MMRKNKNNYMLKDELIAELKMESGLTKKMLERVPLDKADWKPHDKSTSIGRLATHVAEIPNWIDIIVRNDDFDFMSGKFSVRVAANSEELISIFQENLDKAISALETMSDEDFTKKWTVKRGGHVISSNPKK